MTPPDWAAPWNAPLAAPGRAVATRVAAGASLAAALDAQAAADGPRFCAAGPRPAGEAYESYVARTGRVPVRDTLHDLFNGLVWLTQPALKRCVARRHAAEIAAHGVGGRRGPVRDRLTLLDENGALLQAPPALVDGLRRRDWHGLFVTRRGLWADARIVLVGHGLLQRLLQPRPAITAHVAVVPPGAAAETVVQTVAGGQEPLLPLPVLGVPGWWEPNGAPGFYADARVFRPRA